tara:strand:- start:1958 stop:2731 length:774 start_codon:yes stop_codon:yes gene_type:complete
MLVKFNKYQGTGNDFVIIDLTKDDFKFSQNQIKKICDRKHGIGADGLILISNHNSLSFEMKFFNPDGSTSFCGNGSRCAVLFCFHQGIVQSNCSFITNDGIHQGQVLEDEKIKISIKSPVLVDKLSNGDFEVNTGSPHYVQVSESLDNIDFNNYCKSIRNNDKYFQDGININLVKIEDDFLDMRTYERGVEDETLSCGSGVTATALAIAYENKIENSLLVKTRGGKLKVDFERSENKFEKIFLIGSAKFVFSGDYNL